MDTPGGSMLDARVLVVSQKVKLVELTNEYKVFDADGTQVGSVVQVGQGKIKKALRLVSSLDQYMTHKLEVRDADGGVLMSLVRPAKVFKSTIIVSDAAGTEVGKIRQENMVGKIKFALEAGGIKVGEIRGENWRAWNFAIVDSADKEVARITKTWEGLAKTMFTTADTYSVQIHDELSDPLRSLAIAAAVSVDTALKQDSRGLG